MNQDDSRSSNIAPRDVLIRNDTFAENLMQGIGALLSQARPGSSVRISLGHYDIALEAGDRTLKLSVNGARVPVPLPADLTSFLELLKLAEVGQPVVFADEQHMHLVAMPRYGQLFTRPPPERLEDVTMEVLKRLTETDFQPIILKLSRSPDWLWWKQELGHWRSPGELLARMDRVLQPTVAVERESEEQGSGLQSRMVGRIKQIARTFARKEQDSAVNKRLPKVATTSYDPDVLTPTAVRRLLRQHQRRQMTMGLVDANDPTIAYEPQNLPLLPSRFSVSMRVFAEGRPLHLTPMIEQSSAAGASASFRVIPELPIAQTEKQAFQELIADLRAVTKVPVIVGTFRGVETAK